MSRQALSPADSGFTAELRVSPRPVIAALTALALLCFWVGDANPDPSWWLPYVLLALLSILLAALVWVLEGVSLLAARWLAVTSVAAVVFLGNTWIGLPGTLVLLSIPIALAAAFISLAAATGMALVETVALFPSALVDGLGATVVALLAVWATLGILILIYGRVYGVNRWAWEYFRRAQGLLEEARDRKVELQQALEDLAEANLQLVRLNDLAQGLRQAADDARLAKEQFVANVSHELRTPLNMITGFSEMILQSPETYGSRLPPALLADLAVVQRNAEHLAELIDDVLDLSQIEANQMALSREMAPFEEIVDEAVTAVHPLFASKGLYLETEVAPGLPPVFCDRTRMREVLLNLLSNAGRFTERGGVRVRVWREGQNLMVSVADTGVGIAPKNLGKLFEPFHQVDGSIRRRYGGTGLGLPISKRLIELHGGQIRVESCEGAGTTFVFQLPVMPPASDDSWRRLTPGWEFLQHTHPSMAPKIITRPRLVVVESSDVLQRLLSRYWDGVQVARVNSLQEAAADLGRVPALALVVNGASLGEALGQIGTTPLPAGLPAIVCSVPEVHGNPVALGVAERLVKPISREALLRALDRLGLTEGTVLIVDDEPDALQLFGRVLASAGRRYRVLLARDGREALEILHECRPDVILLDLIMPNMDGFQLLEQRRHDPDLRDIPIIVISAQDAAGQPIVSSGVAVTRKDGLSGRQLLACIQFLSGSLSAMGQASGPAQPIAPSG